MNGMSIEKINKMARDEFVALLGEIFEGTPAIASLAWEQRPFENVGALYRCMVGIMRGMTGEEQLELMRSHPDLGSRVRMAEASVQEQAGVGLDRLTAEEYERFQALNKVYLERFGFPFIVAVRGLTKEGILADFEGRLGNGVEVERDRALGEIEKIAGLRLEGIVEDGGIFNV
jgi:2-oxo-4-hydroxy-4-carboxy-5-ureidoimidazoline decarboxylase